jgi:catechol-2,3-dioxygenase
MSEGETLSVADERPRDPEELEAAGLPTSTEIAAAAIVGSVHLRVGDLQRSLRYYRDAVGLDVFDEGAGRARVGVGGRELRGVLVPQPPAGNRSAS